MSYGPLTPEQAKTLQDLYYETEKIRNIAKKLEGVGCLHDACPSCNGTGVRKDGLGMCFHAISCPCPKCSFTC